MAPRLEPDSPLGSSNWVLTFIFLPFVLDPNLFPCRVPPPQWKRRWLFSTVSPHWLLWTQSTSLSFQKHASFQHTLAWSPVFWLPPCPTLSRGSSWGLCSRPHIFSFFQRSQMAARRPHQTRQQFFVWSSVCFVFNLNAFGRGKHSPSSPQSPSCPAVLHPSASHISITCLVREAI